MYISVGTTLILQPDSSHSFVREPDHAMLPAGPGLYNLRPLSRLTQQVCQRPGIPMSHSYMLDWGRLH